MFSIQGSNLKFKKGKRTHEHGDDFRRRGYKWDKWNWKKTIN